MGRPKGSKNKTHKPKIELTCEYCEKTFERFPGHVAREGRGRFCSLSCRAKGTALERKRFGEEHGMWNGGRSSYRQRAIAAYGAKCAECGYDKYQKLLWVHHRDFGRTDHSLENLIVLCIRCHLELHLEYDNAI